MFQILIYRAKGPFDKSAPWNPKNLWTKGIDTDGEFVRSLIDRQTLSVTPPRLRELRVPPLPQGEALYYTCSAMKRLPLGGAVAVGD